jgi:C-methyltransferase C-terminal domain/Putative zinc binding domain
MFGSAGLRMSPAQPMESVRAVAGCRACRGRVGEVVLDLGEQPACDYFPDRDDPGPDPVYPLQMWLCTSCGLAQLVADPTTPEEPRSTEPAALVAQAADAVERVAASGWLSNRRRVVEYGSPHGGSWLGPLAGHGVRQVNGGGAADLVVDCFGLMHAPDQAVALAERAARVDTAGALLLQYHSLGTIVRHGQWNVLRHGHYAYYSTTALSGMLAAVGFVARTAWYFQLYGGTVLLGATRDTGTCRIPDEHVQSLLAEERRIGIRDPTVLSTLQAAAEAHAGALRGWLAAQRSAGKTVLGYGAASRAVALLRRAEVDRTLLSAVADAALAKQGARMPGTDIPIVNPARLAVLRPDFVLLFLSDLLSEVRAAFPEIEASGGQWVDVESLPRTTAQ